MPVRYGPNELAPTLARSFPSDWPILTGGGQEHVSKGVVMSGPNRWWPRTRVCVVTLAVAACVLRAYSMSILCPDGGRVSI